MVKQMFIHRLIVGDTLRVYGATKKEVEAAAALVCARYKPERRFSVKAARDSEGRHFVAVLRVNLDGSAENPHTKPETRIAYFGPAVDRVKGIQLGKLSIGDVLRVYGTPAEAVEAAIDQFNERRRHQGAPWRFDLATAFDLKGREYLSVLRVNADGRPTKPIRNIHTYIHDPDDGGGTRKRKL